MSNVYVTNNWDKPIKADYAYAYFNFPVGQTVEIPVDAARHIFGYMDINKEPYMIRLGFLKLSNEKDLALEILSKFKISEESPKKNHLVPSVVDRVPLPSARKVGGKAMVVNAV